MSDGNASVSCAAPRLYQQAPLPHPARRVDGSETRHGAHRQSASGIWLRFLYRLSHYIET
jgi:hypothetical protein